MVIINKWLVPNGFRGITLFPFIFLKYDEYRTDKTVNHEKIHLKQQLEMLIIPFYIWYCIEYLFKGYHGISFEREAFRNAENKDYLKNRKLFSWFKYI